MIILGGCAGGTGGQRLEQILAPDPRLTASPSGQSSSTGQVASLPDRFPDEIPTYPGAILVKVTQADNSALIPKSSSPSKNDEVGVITRWQTQDAPDRVKRFYIQQFQDNNWQLLSPSAQTDRVMARRENLLVMVTLPAPIESSSSTSPSLSAGKTEFLLQYDRLSNQLTSQSSSSNDQSQPNGEDPTKDQLIGPVLPQDLSNGDLTATPSPSPTTTNGAQTFSDLDKVPASLRSSVADLSALGVLPLSPLGEKSTSPSLLEPNKPITRREYARWLVVANNRFFSDRPAWQIRLGNASTKAIFQDVPASDPDFVAIQGLAEAGIIPSPLSNETAQLFRPDTPLTREQMLLWKVPLDIRRVLPPVNLEAVKEAWGFQDVARIDAKAVQAILADFQNGDLSNIRRVFGYTTLFQPKKAVTRAEAAATLWYFGSQSEGISAQALLKSANPN